MLFVRVDALKSGSPACDVNGAWNYVLPQVSDTDKRIYAMLLAAEMSGQTVVLGGTGGCADFGTIESLNSADLNSEESRPPASGARWPQHGADRALSARV